MNEKLKSFIRAQTRVRPKWVAGMTAILLVAALVTVPLADMVNQPVSAQQQMVLSATAAAGPALSNTINTTMQSGNTTTLQVKGNGDLTTQTQVVGNHDIYGLTYVNNNGPAVCFLQVFDGFPAGAVAVGTSLPKYVFPMLQQMLTTTVTVPTNQPNLPLFNITSALTVSATTTPTGSTNCGTGTIFVSIAFK